MGISRNVEALSSLMNREVDLRRLAKIVQSVGGEGPLRVLIGLYVGPLNPQQAAKVAGEHLGRSGGLGLVGGWLDSFVELGLAHANDRPRKFRTYGVTPKGRKLLEDLIAASSDLMEPSALRELRDSMEPTGVRLIGIRRARVGSTTDAS